MSLIDFLPGNKQAEGELFNPVDGEVIKIEEVTDLVFSQKMMGDGFAVKPENGCIYAPGTGEVVSIFPTKHAISLILDNGVEVLIHIGIDTVELEGVPYDVLVEKGAQISPETQLVNVNLEVLKNAKKTDTIIVVFTNMDEIESYTLSNTGRTAQGELIGKIVVK